MTWAIVHRHSVRGDREKEASEKHRGNRTDGWSDQVMLDRETGGTTARGDLDFALDRGQVGVDRARANDQLLGYLRISESLRHEPQHLHFTRG